MHWQRLTVGYANRQKTRLNGKDYTGGDLAQATQNLPADILVKHTSDRKIKPILNLASITHFPFPAMAKHIL